MTGDQQAAAWDHERDLRKHDFPPIPQDIDPRYPPGAEITLKAVNEEMSPWQTLVAEVAEGIETYGDQFFDN
jgi:hypothetical protein